MSLRTGGREAVEDTETPNPDVLAGLKAAYLAAVKDENEIVCDRIQFAWDYEVHGSIQSRTGTDAEIRSWGKS
jgi:hypothetical protein